MSGPHVTTKNLMALPPSEAEPSRAASNGRAFNYVIWTLIDLGALLVANGLTAAILQVPPMWSSWITLVVMLAVRMAVFWSYGLYRAMVRYTGTHALVVLALGTVLGTGAAMGFDSLVGNHQYGLAFLAIEAILALFLCGGIRLGTRLALEWSPNRAKQRVLIFGAGSLGELVHREMTRLGTFRIVGFLDDDPAKLGAAIHGASVYGGTDALAQVVARTKPDLLVVGILHLPPAAVRELFSACMDLKLRVMIAKGFTSAFSQDFHPELRNLALEDLLSRPSRNLDPAPVQYALHGKRVLVTGAGGSIGSELCHQIAATNPELLVLLDHSEFNLYTIDLAIREKFPYLKVEAVMDNLQSRDELVRLFARHKPNVVFHAAAYKHVPLVEDNPARGVLNNVLGFRNLLETSDAHGVERLVLISTDKAVRPTNVMGATKRVCELLLQNFPAKSAKLCAVRFGNVLGSSGSVMPRFLDQIAKGGPVTVTHPEITRFFMLIPEAVSLVLQSGSMADHGEIFILDMGEPVKIADMARQLIFMTGHRPDEDIKIAYTGLRPGEKLYEELIIDDKEGGTNVDGILIAKPSPIPWPELSGRVDRLVAACQAGDRREVAMSLKEIVPEWTAGERMTRGLGAPAAGLKAGMNRHS
jgi:FlaA1/EpsC-like NDP-sugar epimerase